MASVWVQQSVVGCSDAPYGAQLLLGARHLGVACCVAVEIESPLLLVLPADSKPVCASNVEVALTASHVFALRVIAVFCLFLSWTVKHTRCPAVSVKCFLREFLARSFWDCAPLRSQPVVASLDLAGSPLP